MRGHNTVKRLLTCMLVLTCLGSSGIMSWAGGGSAHSYKEGRRMYEEGILPSGEPMQAVVKGDIPVPGTSFTCVSCHMRSGLGSLEGGVYTTPTNGRTLYAPREAPTKTNPASRVMSMADPENRKQQKAPRPPGRPAYTDESLAAVLRGGVDPTGRVLDPVMPRYHLRDTEMATLIAYLKTLSADFSPGVDDQTMRLATIVTDDAPPEDVAIMLTVMQDFVANTNTLEKLYQQNARKLRKSMKNMPFRKLSLTRWNVKGPPATWRAQLEEQYRREPVFALVGGMAGSEWQPIHAFSEDNQIPTLFPITDFPVISLKDWYTQYLSKGLFQEGEAVARYLHSEGKLSPEERVVQIIRSTREGEALADGFQKAWQEAGRPAPVTVRISETEPLKPAFLHQLLSQEKPAALLFWTGAGDLPLLSDIVKTADAPRQLYVSAGYLKKGLNSIPEAVRAKTFIAYPYRIPDESARFDRDIDRIAKKYSTSDEQLITVLKTFYGLRILSQALNEIQGNYFRDYLLDAIGMQTDIESPPYERVSFGPGQRYAAKGCHIVQLAPGTPKRLIKKSEWVIH